MVFPCISAYEAQVITSPFRFTINWRNFKIAGPPHPNSTCHRADCPTWAMCFATPISPIHLNGSCRPNATRPVIDVRV